MLSVKNWAWMMVAVAGAMLLPRAADAQVEVSASVSAERVYVGDGLQLDIEVNGAKNAERPRVAAPDGTLVEFAGGRDTSRRSIMIINGRRAEESFDGYVFSYRVLANEAGRHTIPAVTVVVDGKEYRTAPVSFTAVEPGDATGFKLTLESEKTEVFVGEPVKVRITWLLTGDVRGGHFSMPASDGAFELLSAPVDESVPGGQDFTLFGKPATTIPGFGILDGRRCETISVDRVFVARRAGDVTLGPIRLAFDAVVGRGAFGRSERKVITSNTVEFRVKALPEPRPSNFNGLIGEYRVESMASATDVHVGDPITLTVLVYGPEPLEAVPPMDFSEQPGFAGSFRASGEPAIPSMATTSAGRAAVFTTTIRAEDDEVREIPPVELGYFDVETGKYGVARSEPIPIKVKATTEVTLPGDAGGATGEAGNGSNEEVEGVGGLAPIVTSPVMLTEGRFDVVEALRSPLGIAVIGGPALLYVGSAGVVALRRRAERDPARRRRRGAPGRALRRLSRAGRRGGGAVEVGAALRGFVADWFDLPEAGITSAECVSRLEETWAGTARELGAVLERCDAALYGGGEGAVGVSEAQEAVRKLVRELEGKA